MTLKELEAEAKKHGYYLTKEQPPVYPEPCTCGCSRRYMVCVQGNKYYFECIKCGFHTEPMGTKYEAKLKWNECIENTVKENHI